MVGGRTGAIEEKEAKRGSSRVLRRLGVKEDGKRI